MYRDVISICITDKELAFINAYFVPGTVPSTRQV